MPERSIGIVCKTIALTGYPGSNPGPDTNVESPALLRMRDRSTGSFVYRNTLVNQSSSGPDTNVESPALLRMRDRSSGY